MCDLSIRNSCITQFLYQRYVVRNGDTLWKYRRPSINSLLYFRIAACVSKERFFAPTFYSNKKEESVKVLCWSYEFFFLKSDVVWVSEELLHYTQGSLEAWNISSYTGCTWIMFTKLQGMPGVGEERFEVEHVSFITKSALVLLHCWWRSGVSFMKPLCKVKRIC